MSPAKRGLLAATLLVFALTWIRPVWPAEQALHSSLTVVGLVALVQFDRRHPLRTVHFAAVCGFIAAHCVAARWLYSNVPYDAWLRATFGWSPNEALGLHRNHADRVIHFLFGLCFAPPLAAHARRRWPALQGAQAAVLALGAIMCTSLVYEWFEWGIALTLSPEAAESYNGQQGDMWDAHMDMLLATVGAMLPMLFLRREAMR